MAKRLNCVRNVSTLAVALVSTIAFGQTETLLEEVVVSATKDDRALSKVPVSVSAYTQEAMDVRAIRNVSDLVAQTPGIDFVPNGPRGAARLAIRGIDSSAGAATTATYLDETPMQSRNSALNYVGSTFPQVFDLERVEVLRGPQGTLFGASAQGGAVRFITPTPSLTEFSGFARALYSSIDGGSENYEIGGAIGGPIVEDKLGFRLSVARRHDGGWIDRQSWQNPANGGKNINETDNDIVRAALRWDPTEWLSVMPAVFYQRRDIGDLPTFWASLSDVDHGRFVSGQAIARPGEDEFFLPSLKIEARLGDYTLTSVTGYYDRDVTGTADQTNVNDRSYFGNNYTFPVVPGWTEVASTMFQHTEQQDFTQEVRFGNMGSGARLQWQAGVYYSRGKLHADPRLLTPHLNDLFQHVTGRSIVDVLGSDNIDGVWNYIGDEHTRETSLAAFVNLEFAITDKLTATLGGRISRDKLEFSVLERSPDYGVTGQQSAAGTIRNEPFTPKVSLSYQADPNNMFYVSYAEGYRTGGVNKSLPGTCDSDLVTLGISKPGGYDPDRTKSYELGSKNRLFGGRMQVELSAFYIKWEEIQQQIRLPTCNYSLVTNTGGAISKGFDLNINVEPIDNLLVGASIGYNDAEYDSSITIGTRPLVFKGQTLGQTPWTATVSTEYHFDIAGYYAFARAQYTYRDHNDGPFNWQNPAFAQYDPTRVVNDIERRLDLRLGIDFDLVDVQIFVENATNEAPILDFTPVYIGAPVQLVRTLQPRTIGAMFTKRF